MKNSILNKKSPVQASLSLDDYKKLKAGLKKKISSKSSLYTFGKTCFVLGLPILAVNSAQAQCQTFSVTNSAIPDNGGTANGLDLDLDGDGNDDIRFFEIAGNATGKVRRLGTMSIVRTNGPYTTFSAFNFANGAAIPNGLPVATLAYWDYGGGGQWPVEPAGPSATGFMGIRKGADYGFLEFTVQRVGSIYFASFPSGGAPQVGAGNADAGDCNSILPVEFMSFITETKGKDVTLIWRTSSETNNAGFEVQRSENGQDFKDIHWEEGQGDAAFTSTYRHTDEGLEAGKIYYYRLKQIDFNGQFDLSPTVSVRIVGESTETSDFYPNPTSDVATLDISTTESSDWFATVFDAKGVSLATERYALTEGFNRVTVHTEKLIAGTYFVKFDNGKERFYKTLIVE